MKERKTIAVVICSHPLRGKKAVEAARMAVGLTLRNPEVHLFLLGQGTEWLAETSKEDPNHSEFQKHLNALTDMGCPVIVEKESMHWDQDTCMGQGVESWELVRILEFLTHSHVTIVIEE